MKLKTADHTKEDLLQVARIHMAQLDLGFLSSLGEKTLVLMYSTISLWDRSMLVTAHNNGKVVGFVSGTLSVNGLYLQFLKRDLFRWIIVLLPKLSPLKFIRIIELLIYPSKRNQEKIEIPKEELLTLAVTDAAKGTGCASALYVELSNFFKQNKSKGFRIMVGDGLERAKAFYTKMGAEKMQSVEVHIGENSWIFVQWLR